MKKRVVMIATLLAVSSSLAFASVELDLSLYFTPIHNYNAEKRNNTGDSSIDYNQNLAIGAEMQWGFFFCPVKIFNFGWNISYGLDFFRTIEIKYHNDSKFGSRTFNGDGFGMNGFLGTGPALRFNIGELHSIYVSPGLKTNMGGGTVSYEYKNGDVIKNETNGYFAWTLQFNIDLGYRIWLSNSPGFHLGAQVGADVNIDFPRGIFITGKNLVLKSGTALNIYLGLCLNFGDKGQK